MPTKVFPPNICALLEPALAAPPPGLNMTNVLDNDWAFVSCALSNDKRNEIVVTLCAANQEHKDALGPTATDYSSGETHILITIDDLDILNGRALGLDVVALVLEQLLIFTRQTAPSEVSGVIRLPGWSAAF
jgi:hypothetical protein